MGMVYLILMCKKHKIPSSYGKQATVAAVRAPGRFGDLNLTEVMLKTSLKKMKVVNHALMLVILY